MIQDGYSKETANELCRRLRDGLGFSCSILLLKRTIISPHGKKYFVDTDAPECVVQDIMVKT